MSFDKRKRETHLIFIAMTYWQKLIVKTFRKHMLGHAKVSSQLFGSRFCIFSFIWKRGQLKMWFDDEPNECEMGLHPTKNTKDVLSSIHMHIWN